MTSFDAPTSEEVSRAVAAMVTAEHARYFFSRLENPAWIGPLAQAGLFSVPPAPRAQTEQEMVAYPDWPALDYLVRVAPEAPEAVAEIIQQLPETDNAVVYERVADVALALPASHSAKVVDQLLRGLDLGSFWSLPTKLARLATTSASTGDLEGALRLLTKLLETQCDARDDDGPLGGMRDPVPSFDEWQYREIVEHFVPVIARAYPLPTVRLLRRQLHAALGCMSWSDERFHDGSTAWHEEIADPADAGSREIPSLLLCALRDAMIEGLETGALDLDNIQDELDDEPFGVFARLWLFLVRERGAVADVDAALVRTELAMSMECDREVFDLLRERWMEASEGAQREFLRGIGVGDAQSATTDDVEKRFVERRRQLFLTAIDSGMPDDAREELERLEAVYGLQERPARALSSWVGPTSPWTEQELMTLDVSGLVRTLGDWEPNTGWAEPTREGAGRALEQVVKKRAVEVSAAASSFAGLDPTYVRAVLRGLVEAARAGSSLHWDHTLELLEYVAARPREVDAGTRRGDEDRMDSDPHWGWARQEAATLVAASFRDDTAGLPPRLRRRAWDVLTSLEWDPDPLHEWEQEHVNDPLTGSLNTVRGQVLRSVIAYLLWVRRSLEKEGVVVPGQPGGLERMPEVAELLQRHLDEQREKSPSVRAVYGENLPFLVLVDPAWVDSHLRLLLPEAAASKDLRLAVWETYVLRNPLYTSVFDVCYPEYEAAVERVRDDDRWDSVGVGRNSVASRLGEHLVTAVVRGKLSPKDDLFRSFFARAKPDAAAQAIRFAGESAGRLVPTSAWFPALGRLALIWSELVGERRSREASAEELAGIGWWLGAPYTPRWLARQLRDASRCGADLPEHTVLEHLPRLAQTAPLDTLEVLESFLYGTRGRWIVLGMTDVVERILEALLRSASSRERVVQLVHELGARGMPQFRGLVSSGTR